MAVAEKERGKSGALSRPVLGARSGHQKGLKVMIGKMAGSMNYADGSALLSTRPAVQAKGRGDENPETLSAEHKYKRIEGAVFITRNGDLGPANPNDIIQGVIGDCYLMAALSAVAKSDPHIIYDMIKVNKDGSYTVTFHLDRMGLSFLGKAKEEVKVDSLFPVDEQGMPVYANYRFEGDKYYEEGKIRAELWPMIVEKAWAKIKGSYKAIEGGDPGQAMEAITGKESRSFTTDRLSADEILIRIGQALKKGHPVTASTHSGKRTMEEEQIPLWRQHAYAVMEVKQNRIELYNPWGKKHPRLLTAEEFKKYFREVYINAR